LPFNVKFFFNVTPDKNKIKREKENFLEIWEITNFSGSPTVCDRNTQKNSFLPGCIPKRVRLAFITAKKRPRAQAGGADENHCELLSQTVDGTTNRAVTIIFNKNHLKQLQYFDVHVILSVYYICCILPGRGNLPYFTITEEVWITLSVPEKSQTVCRSPIMIP